MASPEISTASTYRFKLTATKDGEVWDLTAATITLKLRDPSGTTTTKSASILSAVGGTAYYDCSVSDLTTEGSWRRSWRVVQGSVDVTSPPVRFQVTASP